MMRAPVEPGTDVVVLGLGQSGSAPYKGRAFRAQGKSLLSSPQVRRELALKLGATAGVDPNVDRDQALITRIRNMCSCR